MSALPDGNPAARRGVPQRPARQRRPRSPSPYEAPGSLPQPTVVELPPGYQATVTPPLTSDGFIGGAFSMDSLAFLRWAARYFHDDLAGLRVLLFLMGSQEPGGVIKLTQQDIADALSLQRTHVSRVITKLTGLGVVWMRRRGLYQLQPASSLRGGTRPVEPERSARRSRPRGEKVDQLSLLAELVDDPDVPEAFRRLAQPDPILPSPPPKRGRKAGRKAAEPEEG